MTKQLDAASQTAKWIQGVQQKGAQNYRDGINKTSVNPMQVAASKASKWAAGVQHAISSGSWVKGLNAADPNSWKANALAVGADRLTTGAQKSKAKYQAKVSAYHGFLQGVLSQISTMPDDTAGQRLARQTAYAQAVLQYKQGS